MDQQFESDGATNHFPKTRTHTSSSSELQASTIKVSRYIAGYIAIWLSGRTGPLIWDKRCPNLKYTISVPEHPKASLVDEKPLT